MEKSSFFNAELVGESYDRTYLAEDYAEYFSSFIGNGVFPNPSTNLQINSDGTSMNLVLKKGKAWINGYFYYNTDDLILPIQPADGVLNRIDRIVLRLDFLNREIKCYVKKGAFASIPTAPSLQRDADMYELGIADIKVNKGVIKITQADITDLRQNSNYCGLVHGTIEQIDATNLFAQYGAAFNEWFSKLQGAISGDVAGNLFNMVQENKRAINTINIHSTIKNKVDEYGVATEILEKRKDGTLATKSILSGGTSPKYTNRAITLYAEDGITIIETVNLAITYDANNVPSEVII